MPARLHCNSRPLPKEANALLSPSTAATRMTPAVRHRMCVTRLRLQLGAFQRSFCWITIWQCLTGPARRVRWGPSEKLRAENADWAPTLGPRCEEGHPNLEPRRQEQCQDLTYRDEGRQKAKE